MLSHPKPVKRAGWRERLVKRKQSWRQLNDELNVLMIARDGYLHCEECGANESEVLSRHHVTFKSQGGKDVPDNLKLLCRDCHAAKHGVSRHFNSQSRKDRDG